MPAPATTVFCAAWSGDPDRHALLERHYENLCRQSVPVEIVYVFDSGDAPPRDLPVRKISSSEPLTIYEAWNLALASCQTTYVMNLNLDDRLCADAVERLEEQARRDDAALVGGDWRICYSQEDTDRPGLCVPAGTLDFDPRWPPPTGLATRLGSGTGQRGTYGPATLWRLDCHVGMPRYPYRTVQGTKIRSISDSLWWDMVIRLLKRKASRLPWIIGNYHSHPQTQAEFRVASEHDLLARETVSLV
jgi:hypothetical protein